MDEFKRLWNMMDEFMEGNMDFESLEQEFDRQFARMEQDFYREFLHTLCKTVELCHKMECCQVPENVHTSLCKAIECTPQAKKRPKTRRKK